MTVTPTHPGVYVTEVPSGNRTIVGVATSIVAFVGTAARGPVDRPVSIGNFSEFERTFGALSTKHGLGYAVWAFYLNGGGQAVITRIAHKDTDDTKSASWATIAFDGLTLRAIGPGTWANGIEVSIEHVTGDDAETIADAQGMGVQATDLFTLTLSLGDEVETYRNVTVTDGPRRLDTILQSSRLMTVVDALPPQRPPTSPALVRVAGAPGEEVDLGDYDRGFSALDLADIVNILVLPPTTPSGTVAENVWVRAAQYAKKRRAIAIIDPPADPLPIDSADGALSWPGQKAGASSYAAFYYPRIRHADPLRNGTVGTFAPGGAIAGVYARTDASRGVWKAPAGLEANLVGVVELAQQLTNDENGRLNQVGVNALRAFRGSGSVAWGARTTRGSDMLADDYKYIPVRRLALFLEETLYRGTQWVVFEPNDEPLWSQIRLSIGAFMQDLFRKGAFQGTSPKEAYVVRCDAETTTQYDRDRGIVNIHVGFAPLKPAEFVMISIQQMTASTSS